MRSPRSWQCQKAYNAGCGQHPLVVVHSGKDRSRCRSEEHPRAQCRTPSIKLSSVPSFGVADMRRDLNQRTSGQCHHLRMQAKIFIQVLVLECQCGSISAGLQENHAVIEALLEASRFRCIRTHDQTDLQLPCSARCSNVSTQRPAASTVCAACVRRSSESFRVATGRCPEGMRRSEYVWMYMSASRSCCRISPIRFGPSQTLDTWDRPQSRSLTGSQKIPMQFPCTSFLSLGALASCGSQCKCVQLKKTEQLRHRSVQTPCGRLREVAGPGIRRSLFVEFVLE